MFGGLGPRPGAGRALNTGLAFPITYCLIFWRRFWYIFNELHMCRAKYSGSPKMTRRVRRGETKQYRMCRKGTEVKEQETWCMNLQVPEQAQINGTN
jgi:hypothetical protein